ncbi:MAG: flagellar hook-basal body complex protein FliE [Spirochaetales bacterium]|nr:flagellar hook-basal body complex protein FliE [Spirochaetales bacterium]
MFYSAADTNGLNVQMARTSQEHLTGRGEVKEPETTEKAFGEMLLNAFNQVNDLQGHSNELSQQMITNPDSVNVHDVTIAIAEANMALSMTKSIVDGAIKAYREIISTR